MKLFLQAVLKLLHSLLGELHGYDIKPDDQALEQDYVAYCKSNLCNHHHQ